MFVLYAVILCEPSNAHCTAFLCILISPPLTLAVFLSEEVEGSSWLDKVVVTLILCLRDWLVALPIPLMVSEEALDNSTLKSVFEVRQLVAVSYQLNYR